MRLIFVYNVNSGKLNAVLDTLHKITSPDSYDCNLCALTFGNFSENKIWKDFRESSRLQMEFFHKDEFLESFNSEEYSAINFPVIFFEQNEELKVYISSEELNEIDEVEILIDEIKKRQLQN